MKKLFKNLLFCLLIIMGITSVGYANTTYQEYYNQTYKYSLDVPEKVHDRILDYNDASILVPYNDDLFLKIGISNIENYMNDEEKSKVDSDKVDELDINDSIFSSTYGNFEYIKTQGDRLAKEASPDAKIVGTPEKISLNGTDAYKIKYDMLEDPKKPKTKYGQGMRIFTIHQGNMYDFVFVDNKMTKSNIEDYDVVSKGLSTMSIAKGGGFSISNFLDGLPFEPWILAAGGGGILLIIILIIVLRSRKKKKKTRRRNIKDTEEPVSVVDPAAEIPAADEFNEDITAEIPENIVSESVIPAAEPIIPKQEEKVVEPVQGSYEILESTGAESSSEESAEPLIVQEEIKEEETFEFSEPEEDDLTVDITQEVDTLIEVEEPAKELAQSEEIELEEEVTFEDIIGSDSAPDIIDEPKEKDFDAKTNLGIKNNTFKIDTKEEDNFVKEKVEQISKSVDEELYTEKEPVQEEEDVVNEHLFNDFGLSFGKRDSTLVDYAKGNKKKVKNNADEKQSSQNKTKVDISADNVISVMLDDAEQGKMLREERIILTEKKIEKEENRLSQNSKKPDVFREEEVIDKVIFDKRGKVSGVITDTVITDRDDGIENKDIDEYEFKE